MIWKALFDGHKPGWHVYGRVVFVDADDEGTARDLATTAGRAEYPEMERIEIVAIGVSTAAARAAFEQRKAMYAEWLRRTHPAVCPTCGRGADPR